MSDKAKVFKNRQRGWCVKLHWQGKRHYFSKYLGIPVRDFKELADRLAMDINTDIDKGVFNPARYKQQKPLHLKQYSETWLDLIKPSISTATWHDYESSLRLHILPILGDEFLPDINKDKLTRLLSSINREPKGKKNVMGCLNKLMSDAFDSGHISQMPKFPKMTGKNEIIPPGIEWIEPSEQFAILEKIPLADRPIFTFITLTGCRPSEARAFRKVDLKKDHIVFAKTFGRKGELKEVKGKKIMTWPMTDTIRELFESIPKNLTPWIFPNPRTGKPYSKNINRIWNMGCKETGIKISLNNAGRHSFACQMLNANVQEGMVSRLLRHSDPRMIKRYGEYKTNALKTEVDRVQKLSILEKSACNPHEKEA